MPLSALQDSNLTAGIPIFIIESLLTTQIYQFKTIVAGKMYQIASSEFIIGTLHCSRARRVSERINKARNQTN